ncbi:MAG TPA: hypothetical protein VN714_23850 [Trebonia sp.]|nr:hypothetical protein [Trebonia sp.]
MITGQPDADPGSTEANAAPPGAASAARPAGRFGAPRPLLRLRWALPAALASGLLLAIAFPPVGAWPLAVLSPALFILVLYGRSLRGAFTVGLVFGLAFFFPLLAWVVNLAWFAWVALAIASALIFAVFTSRNGCYSTCAGGRSRSQAGGWRPKRSGTAGHGAASPGGDWR